MGLIFLKVLEMSIAALLLIAAVVLIRIPLRRAPKWFMGVLWAIVALRLLIPVQVTAQHVGFMPDFGNIVDACFDEDTKAADVTEQEMINSKNLPQSESSQGIPIFLPIIWLIGMLSVLSYAAFSYIKVKKRTAASIRYLSGDRVFVCDDIDTPFIFGFVKPSIYMPSGLDDNTIRNVLAHERAHIERFDHLRKQLGFLILAIHWFNPLVWIAYMLFCRDIELACDERAVSSMSLSQKKSYATSLLSCSTSRKMVLAYPLAFGEVGVGTRVKQIFDLKKPTAWLVAGLVLICGILSASSFTKAADKPVVAQIQIVEPGNPEVSVQTESVVPAVNVIDVSASGTIHLEEVKEESKEETKEETKTEQKSEQKTEQKPVTHEVKNVQESAKSGLVYTDGMDRVAVTVPNADADGGAVEVNADGDVHVEVTEEAVNVTVDDGHEEVAVSRKVLNAAAMTYVASAASAVIQLLRLIALNNRRR
jgi:beta-lactamase regulating signal transducer with metallopeptidase domain